MWLIIRRAGSGGKLHSRIFLFEQTQSIGTLTGDWSCELCRETNIDFSSILLHLMQIFSTLWWHFVFFMIFAFLCPVCWISRYLKANSPAAADMEDLGAGGKYRVRFFFAASSKASEKEKSIFLQRGRILFWWLALTQLVSWLVLCHLLISQISLSVFNSCVLRILPIAANREVKIRTLKNTEFSIFFRRALILAKAIFYSAKNFWQFRSLLEKEEGFRSLPRSAK